MVVVAETREVVRTGPLGEVQSRVSWGAILAGAAVALAVYFLLGLLGIAIGLSLAENVNGERIGTGAAIWSFLALVVALFFGGWVTTQCTAGENRTEAILYGIVVWAVTSTLMFHMTASGLAVGYQTLRARQPAGDATVSAAGISGREIATAGQQIGLSDTQVRQLQDRFAMDRRSRDRDRDGNRDVVDDARTMSWWAFGGTLLSMLAAIGGALVGPYEVVLRRGVVATTTRP